MGTYGVNGELFRCISRTFGIISKDSANSAIASCSLDPKVVARFSRYTDRAASTAPPPATTYIPKQLQEHEPNSTK